MEKCLYYKSTAEDKERAKELVKEFVSLVGHLPMGMERILTAAYEKDFTKDTIYTYDKAWHVLENMAAEANKKRFSIYTSQMEALALCPLYNSLQAEMNYLSGIFREFEQIGIYVDQ